MRRLLTRLSKRRFPYEPLVTVTISRTRLIHNLHEFMKVAPRGTVAPVLKSNAYGHGLVDVARIIEAERRSDGRAKKDHIPFLVVDSFFEAVALRAARVRSPLLIIGYTRPETIARSRLRDVSFTISSIETLRHIAEYQYSFFDFGGKRISIHLKIDTGMHRQGILPSELHEVSDLLDMNPSIVLKGICSHFSSADDPDPSATESQIHIWNKVAKELHNQYSSLEHIHISNTDGHRYVKECYATVSRLGLGLYGLADGSVFSPPLDLKPVMSLETIITGTKKLQRDDTVGYGNTFKAEKEMTIATLPLGYYEGVDRRLSNKGIVLVGPERVPCKIIGRVSMNITVIDVTDIPPVQAGTTVTVISNQPHDPNSVVHMAEMAGTIPYEIAVHVSGLLKKEVIGTSAPI
jgi:alanine racemase